MPKTAVNWHSAVISGFKIELSAYRNFLTYHPEFTLNTGIRRIDCLIEKAPGSPRIPSPIACKFRRYNIFDYKSPHESMNILNYHKVLSYAHSLPDLLHNDSIIPELTITLVTHKYPRKLVKYLTCELGKSVEKIIPGLYYIDKEICHCQIVVLPGLPQKEYLWLRNLTNALTPDAPLRTLGRNYRAHQEDEDYRNFMNTLIRANHMQKGLDEFMCEALYELFADKLVERENIGMERGLKQGISEGLSQGLSQGMDRLSALIQKLLSDNRSTDIARVTSDPAYRDELLNQYDL